eukprot:m.255804 g.255804  ORF g.255804 m.255804 type:complete len:1368 (+) comp22695_c0_seq14:45-4148(+)
MDTVTAYRKLIAQVQGVLNAHPQRAVKVHWTVPPYKVISSSLAVVRVPWPTDRLSPYATQLLLFLVGLCFILYRILDIAYEEHYRLTPILVVGILVCAFALMNLGFLKREREKRYCEMAERVREITRSLENKLLPALRNTRRLHYTDPVNTAPNPSVDTVSTVRDSIMVGVPANLLVEGDVIFLCPGDKTPAEVRVLDDRVMPTKTFARKFSTPEVPSSGERLPRQRGLLPPNLELARGEVVQLHVQEDVEEPCFVQPHRRHRFKVLQTPLESDLKQMLKQVENRPVSGRIKTRIATTVLLQRIGLVLFLLSLVVNCVRLGVVGDDVGSWVEMVLVLPCTALLPLLPVTLPLVWFSVNLFTAARLEAYFTGGVRTAVSDAGGEGDGDTSSAGSDSTVSTSLSDDRWEDEENEQDELGRRRRWWINAPRSLVLDHFLRMFRGTSKGLPRTSNIMHVFASLSVLAFVDKDGILSQPSLQADKVFMFRAPEEEEAGDGNKAKETDGEPVPVQVDCIASARGQNDTSSFAGLLWDEHLSSMKPLGLNILLNSLCVHADNGKSFVDHLAFLDNIVRGGITNEYTQAAFRSNTQPPVCLCKLAMDIGFTSTSLASFTLRQATVTIAPVLRNATESLGGSKESDVKRVTLHTARHVPLPYMTSLVAENTVDSSCLLMASGTPDLVLASCSDLWDGRHVVPMTEHTQNEVNEFFKSSSDGSMCYAFAYRPMYRQGKQKHTPKEMPVHFCEIPFQENKPKKMARVQSWSAAASGPLAGKGGTAEDSTLADPLSLSPTAPGRRSASFTVLSPPAGGGPPLRARFELGEPEKQRFSPKPPRKSNSTRTVSEESRELEPTTSNSANTINGSTAVDVPDNLIFLGMVRVQEQPLADIEQLVSDMNNAGVRFVYFSQEDELEAIAFADKLGLETGWNCAVSLSSRSDQAGGASLVENISQLPRGIRAVRPHLENVDDVPLQVPVFTDCDAAATVEMIGIMQENNRVVCCLGSALNSNSMAVFAQADVSISQEPLRDPVCHWSARTRPRAAGSVLLDAQPPRGHRSAFHHNHVHADSSAEEVAMLFNSLPCVFHMRRTEFRLATFISEARRLDTNAKQCFVHLLWLSLALSTLLTLNHLVFLPPALAVHHILWLQCIILPLLSVPMLWSPSEPGVMKMLNGLQTEDLRALKRKTIYFFLRNMFTVAVLLVIFALCMQRLCERSVQALRPDVSCQRVLGARNVYPSKTWNGFADQEYESLLFCQNVVCWLFVVYAVLGSSTYLHQSLGFRRFNPLRNRVWLGCCVVALLLETGFVAASMAINEMSTDMFDQLPWSAIVLAIVWCFLSMLIHVLVKRHANKYDVTAQKRARLLFDTKLGMHSPI